MNLQQLRSVRETVRCGFNLTEVARRLHTSQPGISRQIRELETELGVPIFARAGKRLLGLTEPGRKVLPLVERMLENAVNLKRCGDEFALQGHGTLTISTTHTQARYLLPRVVRDFRQAHEGVVLHIHQGAPQHVARMLRSGDADIGIATDILTAYEDLVTLPCYRWSYCAVVPRGHALADGQPLTLERLAAFPLISYDAAYTGRTHIDQAFRQQGLVPNFIILAMNADVIKTYVELDMGVGIVASMAMEGRSAGDLVAVDASHLFEGNVTHIAVRRSAFLRAYEFDFITQFAPQLTRDVIEQAMHSAEPAA